MKMIFISNYFNHHQMPICDELFSNLGEGNFFFIETMPMEESRKRLGWHGYDKPYLIQLHACSLNIESVLDLINNADVVVAGSSPYSLVENRIKNNKLVFYYSERLFKSKLDYLKYFKWRISYKKRTGQNVYVLCASAYASADYSKLGLYKSKCFKWGYFPEAITYSNFDNLLNSKEVNNIVWVGRLISWKHADDAIKVTNNLKSKYNINLKIIGDGPLKNKYKQLVKKLGLESRVEFVGSMAPEMVRRYMEKAQICLFTSDFNEGWGAVLNEAMNSGCIVVANHAAGSTPYLIRNGKNGFIYSNHNIKEFTEIVDNVLGNKKAFVNIAKNAYLTINDFWCSKIAAKRLIMLSKNILSGETADLFNDDGPCSSSNDLTNNWFQRKVI